MSLCLWLIALVFRLFFAASTGTAVQKADKELEKARKNAEKWKIEPTTEGIEAAARELDRLNATIVNQQAELANCEREHARVQERYGETSSQALRLEKRMLSLEASIEKNVKKSDDFAAALSDAEKVMDQATESAEKAGKASKQAGNGMEDGGRGAKTFDVALGTLIGNGLSDRNWEMHGTAGADQGAAARFIFSGAKRKGRRYWHGVYARKGRRTVCHYGRHKRGGGGAFQRAGGGF